MKPSLITRDIVFETQAVHQNVQVEPIGVPNCVSTRFEGQCVGM